MAVEINAHQKGMRSSLLGLITNALLATVKLVAGLLGQSYALIADAVESMADVFASIVVWSGLRISAQPPDEGHPYGHGKAEQIAALIVSLTLFAAGLGIAFEAISAIVSGERTPPAGFTLIVLIGVVIIKEALFQVVSRVGSDTGSIAVVSDAWHHRSDAITSAAAAVGISVSLVWGYAAADDWAALIASGVILFNAYRLIKTPVHELMEAEPTHVIDEARTVAGRVPGVHAIEKVFARKSGARYWIDMHLEVDPAMSVRNAHALAHDVKENIRAAMPHVQDVLIHVEPYNGPLAPTLSI